jgi:hypothetical protein
LDLGSSTFDQIKHAATIAETFQKMLVKGCADDGICAIDWLVLGSLEVLFAICA